jgi:hypothetical protein
MVSVWWLLWAFLAGGFIGFLLFAVLVATRDGEDSQMRAMRMPGYSPHFGDDAPSR